MNIYIVDAFDGELGFLVIADTRMEAVRLAKKKYENENEETLKKVAISESAEVKKGVIGSIDWTEPEPPIFDNPFAERED